MSNEKVYTTYEAAKICNAHYTTVIGWIEEGKLKAYVTPGGHRRIEESDLIDFMKNYNIPLPEEFTRNGKLVLLVDDDPQVLEELKSALEGNGFDLDLASSGFEAGRKIYGRRPDLILLDFRMPGMDGFQVCEVLSKDKLTAEIPIFAVTALGSGEDIKRIKNCGVKEHISKPVDLDRLLKLIKGVLDMA